MFDDLPDSIILKQGRKGVILYAPEEFEADGQMYLAAQGYYFPKRPRGLSQGETFQYSGRKLVSVVEIGSDDQLYCRGFDGFNPKGQFPVFKII